jgi:hypothetical protein
MCEDETSRVLERHPIRVCRKPSGALVPGLGDHIANGLAAIGMTKPRAEAFTRKWLGLGCGCPERQERLNRLGRYVKARAAKVGVHLPI